MSSHTRALSAAMSQNQRSPLCRHFARHGTCKWGNDCRFSHETPAARNSTSDYPGPPRQRRAPHTPTPSRAPRYTPTPPRGPPPPAASPVLDRPHADFPDLSHRTWIHRPPLAAPPLAAPLRIMTYNVLADSLARQHAWELYGRVPRWVMAWPRRRQLILAEVAHYRPGVLALQEVDDYVGFLAALAPLGYEGMHVQRSGGKLDGCALFWLKSDFHRIAYKKLRFKALGLRDNVAQILALRPTAAFVQRALQGADLASVGRVNGSRDGDERTRDSDDAASAGVLPDVIVGNIHVLFNPKRGDIKLGQVRTLCEEISALAQRLAHYDGSSARSRSRGRRSQDAGASRADGEGGAADGNGAHEEARGVDTRAVTAPRGAVAVMMGDFNCVPGSHLYRFVVEGGLDLSAVERSNVSGQQGGFNNSQQGLQVWSPSQPGWQSRDSPRRQTALKSLEKHASAPAMRAGRRSPSLKRKHRNMASNPTTLDDLDGCARLMSEVEVQETEPSAPSESNESPRTPEPRADDAAGGSDSDSATPLTSWWSTDDMRNALGAGAADARDATISHPLDMASAFCDVAGHEPPYTTAHDQFAGSVDYMFYSPEGVPGNGEGEGQEEGGDGDGGADGDGPGGVFMQAQATLLPRFWGPEASIRLPAPGEGSDHVCLVTDFVFGRR